MIEYLEIFWQVIQWMLIIPGMITAFSCLIVMISKYDYLIEKYSKAEWISGFFVFAMVFAAFISWFIFKI